MGYFLAILNHTDWHSCPYVCAGVVGLYLSSWSFITLRSVITVVLLRLTMTLQSRHNNLTVELVTQGFQTHPGFPGRSLSLHTYIIIIIIIIIMVDPDKS